MIGLPLMNMLGLFSKCTYRTYSMLLKILPFALNTSPLSVQALQNRSCLSCAFGLLTKSKFLYNWQFTANQFILMPCPLSVQALQSRLCLSYVTCAYRDIALGWIKQKTALPTIPLLLHNITIGMDPQRTLFPAVLPLVALCIPLLYNCLLCHKLVTDVSSD
jgi:hypothetical protein